LNSIVIELQKEALDSSIHVSDLLRKALFIAKKLDIHKFQEFIELEFNGYSNHQNTPEYRLVSCQTKVFNPFNNYWMPLMTDIKELYNNLSKRYVNQPIAEIEALVQLGQKNNSVLQMPFSDSEALKLMQLSNLPVCFGLRPTSIIDISQLHGIIDAVRNIVLDWSIQLEKEGILGENMSFSEEEKKTASNVTFNINGMYHSQIQHDTFQSVQSLNIRETDTDKIKKLIQQIKGDIEQLDLSSDKKSEFVSDINTIESQLSSSKPKMAVLKECIGSLRNILEGTTGSLLANGIVENIYTISRILGF